MASLQNEGEDQQPASTAAIGWIGKVEDRLQKIKEHAETYPYVWGSYALVYGGFGIWGALRWRKLRKTEDRVRALQQRLRQIMEADKLSSTTASSSMVKPPTSALLVEKSSTSASSGSSLLADKVPK